MPVCGLAVAGRIQWFHRHIPTRDADLCPGFPPPQAALRIILSNEGVEVSMDR